MKVVGINVHMEAYCQQHQTMTVQNGSGRGQVEWKLGWLGRGCRGNRGQPARVGLLCHFNVQLTLKMQITALQNRQLSQVRITSFSQPLLSLQNTVLYDSGLGPDFFLFNTAPHRIYGISQRKCRYVSSIPSEHRRPELRGWSPPISWLDSCSIPILKKIFHLE